MPPKRKGKKKKKDNKKVNIKKTPKKLIGLEKDVFTELSKEYFLIQIRDLEARLDRYQKKCDELEISNKEYENKRQQLHHENSEITEFLRRQLDQKVEEIADLQDRLLGLQQTREAEKESYEAQITSLRQEIVETKEQLTSENMILSGKLASLEEFKQQKEELLEKFDEMEKKLQQQEIEHKDAIYNLEKKAVVDKDRLKREMVQRVNTVAAEFRKVSNKQMADTTKRTIRENVSINSQLAKMSDKTMELIQENDILRTKEKKQHQQIEVLEENEKELARKNISNQKVIRMLAEKAKSQDALIAEYEAREQTFEEQEKKLADLEIGEKKNKKKFEEYEQRMLEITQGSTRLQYTNDSLKEDKNRLTWIITEAAKSLQASLSSKETGDLNNDITDTGTSTSSHPWINDNSLVGILLKLLNQAAAEGVGPRPDELGSSSTEADFKEIFGSAGPLESRDIPFTLPHLKSKVPSHYKVGDLGFVPRYKGKTVINPEVAKIVFSREKHAYTITGTEARNLLKSSAVVHDQKLPKIASKLV